MRGGAVGGIRRDEIPQIVADIVADRTQDLELWIRPEQVGYGYTVEWTTLDDGNENHDSVLDHSSSREPLPLTTRVTRAARQLLSRLTAILQARMPTFDVDREQITVFYLDDRYLFKQYFERDAVFAELQPYYNEDAYRFEVPEDVFEDVQEVLHDYFYDLVVVDDPERFCVVYPKYTEHPEVLFKASVLQRSRGEHHLFLMKDQLSVEQAVEQGATRLADTDLEAGFG